MILPIYAYGHPVLRKETAPLTADYPELPALIENMFATMYKASGIGLAAPQVGLSLRLFVIDTLQLDEEGQPAEGMKRAFINPEIIEEHGTPWSYEEGCLSIPDVHGNVSRQPQIKIRYQDADFNTHEEVLDGMNARVVQHEYDHIEGVLFIDYLKPLKKRMVKKRLDKISKGKISPAYRMKYPK